MDQDFLKALVALQSQTPNNQQLFNMALEGLMGYSQDPKKKQQEELVNSLVNAELGRYAETGDTSALDRISTLFSSDNPLAALKEQTSNTPEGLMQQAQKQFEGNLTPYLNQALQAGDTTTAEQLSQFTAPALQQLQESDVEGQATKDAMFQQLSKDNGELAARAIFANPLITNALAKKFPTKYQATPEQKSGALRKAVGSIYDQIAQQ